MKLSYRIKRKFKINILCTDSNFVYQQIKLANKHILSKSETCLVERKNLVIRRKLARFNRRTSCYSKSIDMISASLLLLFNEELLYSIIG
ncbi:MAG: IS1 family transposase [Alphaproteobacteria bacterium]|nr:IS1 family transposase [Alphaproteobacteria bacterium]